jgi:hypothetical protein
MRLRSGRAQHDILILRVAGELLDAQASHDLSGTEQGFAKGLTRCNQARLERFELR